VATNTTRCIEPASCWSPRPRRSPTTDAIPLRGLLDAGDPYGEARDAWHAKETLRSIYDIADANTGAAAVELLAQDLQDPGLPTEVTKRASGAGIRSRINPPGRVARWLWTTSS